MIKTHVVVDQSTSAVNGDVHQVSGVNVGVHITTPGVGYNAWLYPMLEGWATG